MINPIATDVNPNWPQILIYIDGQGRPRSLGNVTNIAMVCGMLEIAKYNLLEKASKPQPEQPTVQAASADEIPPDPEIKPKRPSKIIQGN